MTPNGENSDWEVIVLVRKTSLHAIIDTGSPFTHMSLEAINKFVVHVNQDSTEILLSDAMTKLKCYGTATIEIKVPELGVNNHSRKYNN